MRKTIRGLSRAVSCHHIRRAFFFWRHGANEYSWVTDIVHLLRSVVELQQHVADLRALQRVFRRAIATDRREYLRGVARDAISSDVKDTVRKLRPLLGPPRRLQRGVTALPAVRLEDGSLAPDKAAADKRWLRHFSSIEDGAPIGREEHVQACLQRQGDLDGLELTKVDVPTRVELERSMRRTACNRAVGNDQLPGDVIHLHTATLSKPVYQIFLKVAYRLSEPLHWKGGTLHSLWKKGDQTLCSSYRAILVSSAVGKSVHSMMRGRCAEYLDATSTPLQIGGRPGQPVLIAAQAVRCFQAMALNKRLSSAVLFIDLKEAFHRVVRPLIHGGDLDDGHIAGIMRALHLPPEVVPRLHEYVRESSLLESAGSSKWTAALIREFNADAWFNYGTSPDIAAVRAGTRPGDSLADLVFSFLFSEVSKRIRQALTDAGIRVHLPWSPDWLRASPDQAATATSWCSPGWTTFQCCCGRLRQMSLLRLYALLPPSPLTKASRPCFCRTWGLENRSL